MNEVINKLKDGKEYWYVSIDYGCQVKSGAGIKVLKDFYQKDKCIEVNLAGNIFLNKKEAEEVCNKVKEAFNV